MPTTVQPRPVGHPTEFELGREGVSPPAWSLWISKQLRRLPPPVVRALIILDALLAAFPPWAYFLAYRWTGRILGPRASWYHLKNGLRFVFTHLGHTGHGGTGPFSMSWSAPPVRGCKLPETPAHEPKGSCGSCKNCCTTHWLPEGQRIACPFLLSKGCSIYGGLYWDYFNCGRYPATPLALSAYTCPRFAGAFDARPVIKKLPIVEPKVPAEAA